MNSVASDDPKLLAALALALVEKPRASLQELAKAAGNSKARLYRFCRTRDELIDTLLQHATTVLHGASDAVDLETGPVKEVLPRLIAAQLEHRELMAFMIYYWKPEVAEEAQWAAQWSTFLARNDAFFLRGQREGVFRIDISAATLTEAFGGLFCGLVEAEVRGRVARASMGTILASLFLNGASS